jgi:hypothetical protein
MDPIKEDLFVIGAKAKLVSANNLSRLFKDDSISTEDVLLSIKSEALKLDQSSY